MTAAAPHTGASDSERVVVEPVDAVRVIRLDRPARRNALDAATVAQLSAAFDEAADAADVRAIVLTGSPPVFCAGSDVAELAQLPADGRAASQAFWPALETTIRDCPVPVVAAIAGGAWGGGLFLALFADLRIAAEDARFAAPEATLGWLPPGGIEALIDAVGVSTAIDLVLTGRTIDAADARRLGLAHEIVPADALMDAALALAARLASLPPAGVMSTKRYFRERPPLDRTARERLALERFAADVATPDADRSLSRFLKR